MCQMVLLEWKQSGVVKSSLANMTEYYAALQTGRANHQTLVWGHCGDIF